MQARSVKTGIYILYLECCLSLWENYPPNCPHWWSEMIPHTEMSSPQWNWGGSGAHSGSVPLPRLECMGRGTGGCLYSFFFFFINLFILFIYFWLHWVFVATHGLSLVAASGGYSSLRCAGFSLRWLLLLRSTGSRRTGFSSCGTWAQKLWLAGSRAQAQ